ncbi:hypothetical protein PJ985_20635 [Streptomyces sp. ACA25]|nr:hypothetical protein [Streptomyces sp. ACA25]MDB1089969.1 hypothetical protein [Streptomyces sp. ACA25]
MEKDIIHNDPLADDEESRSPTITITITIPFMTPEDEPLDV